MKFPFASPAALKRGPAWAVLIILTLAVFAVCQFLRLPAAPLLAAIAAGCFFSLRDVDIQIPTLIFLASQTLLGLMISRSFSMEVIRGMLDNWFLAILIVMSVIVCGLVGGLMITLRQWLPGTTGIWGISPGGAALMTLMSGSYGGDMRLVAIMQYLRVTIVSFVAAGVARFLGVTVPADAELSFFDKLFPPTNYLNFFLTLAVAAVCCQLARLSRSFTVYFLLPMFLGAVLQNTGTMTIELPGWLLAVVFILIGWSIGLRFDRAVFLYAWRAMPKILGAIFFMVGSAGILAGVLIFGWGIDPLTAYLATSPGGADVVAIIAVSSGGNMVFIMGAQTLRLFLVLLTGPYLARAATHFVRKRLPPAG